MKKAPAVQGEGFELHRQDDPQSSTAKALTTQPKFAAQARWRAANPKAAWAHSSLQSALRRGLIERQPCEICGAEPSDGQHRDYDRPADVSWLCRKCHKAEHRKEQPNG